MPHTLGGFFRCLLLCAVVGAGVRPCAADQPQQAPPPVVFDGFGLGDFSGTGSIAAALRQIDAEERSAAEGLRLPGITLQGVAVQGPSGRNDQLPLTAELRSRIERFDVAAGLQTGQDLAAEGPSQWVGRIGVSSNRDEGREALELRTTLGRRGEGGILGVEVGPRVERRLGRGVTFFLDGKAEAQAARSVETGWWSLPGGATDGSSMVGVAARTGLVR